MDGGAPTDSGQIRMLTRPVLGLILLLSLVAPLSGCLNSRDTSYPQLQTGPPTFENRRYQVHDPFPDRSAGPDTMSRPRGYDRQRTEPRRAVDNTMPDGIQGGFGTMSPAPMNGPTSWQYPQTVPQ